MKHVYEVSFNIKLGHVWHGNVRNPFSSSNVVARDAKDAIGRVERRELRTEYDGKTPSAFQTVEVKLVAKDVR